MQIHGGNTAEIARKYRLKESRIIDFSSSINPLGFPQSIPTCIARGIESILCYPDSQCTLLKEEIAQGYNLAPSTILVGNGSTELIYLLSRAFKPKRALLPIPTFSEYEKSLSYIKCKIKYFPISEKSQFRLDTDSLISLLSKTDILYLCNPNNPTGTLIPSQELDALITHAEKRGVLTVVDEAFLDFTDAESLIGKVGKNAKLIVLKSLTKFFGIPGVRLGYVVAHPKLITQMSRFKEPWTVNVLAQKIGLECLRDRKFKVNTVNYMKKERNYLIRELSKLQGLKIYSSVANYLLIKIVKTDLCACKLYERAAQQGILIRDCKSFKGLRGEFIRVAVKQRRHNARLIKMLKQEVEG